jgi:hypothetical protein
VSLADLPSTLHVSPDHTPGVHPVLSDEVRWWLPVLGPTCTVLAQALADHARHGLRTLSTDELAHQIGLAGHLSHLATSLTRLERFRVISTVWADTATATGRLVASAITVRMELPALPERHLARLPERMAAAYVELAEQRVAS